MADEQIENVQRAQQSPEQMAAEAASLAEVMPKQPATPMMDIIGMLSRTDGSATATAQFLHSVVEQEVLRAAFDQDWKLAKVIAWSGQFAELKDLSERQAISTAMVKVRLGRAWNMNEADAMQFVYFTNGRPSVMNELFASKLRDAGYDWDIAYDYHSEPAQGGARKKKKCIGCTIFPKRWNARKETYEPILAKQRAADGEAWVDVRLEVSFTKDDADGAMIWERGKQIPLSEKWNFKSWPEDMYFWRALSRFRKRYAANILSGAVMAAEAEDVVVPAQRQIAAPVATASLSLEAFRPSEDKHRGHDESMATAAEEKAEADPAPTTKQEQPKQQETPRAQSTHRGPIKAVDELSDAMDFRLGYECYQGGRHFRVAEDGDLQKWVDIGAAPEAEPEPAEESPDPKLAAAPRGRGGRSNKPADAFDFNNK